MNTAYRKPLPGTRLDYFDTRAAVDAIQPGAYDTLPYTSRVFADNLVRRCDPATLTASLTQLIERTRDLDFPWFPARVVRSEEHTSELQSLMRISYAVFCLKKTNNENE